MNHFHYLSELGEIALPNQQKLTEISEKNEQPIIILDSCVCLDIITLIKHKKSARVDKIKIFNLIEYIQKNNIEAIPIFALIELCYDKSTFEIQEDKLWDIKNKIDFALKYPIKRLKKLNFDYNQNFIPSKNPKLLVTSIAPLASNLNLYYAGLLKIREISNNGLKNELAEKNIQKFIQWMINLDLFLGLEYSLALAIFGGDSKLRSMIKLGSTPEKVIKSLWGSAWDLFHARISCNAPELNKIFQKSTYPIFATRDYALYKLMAPHVENNIRYNSSKLTLRTKNEYPKHYSSEFINELNKTILQTSVDRIDKPIIYNHSKINSIIRELEAGLI
ncbi:hypothetical protein MATR_26840 [Marivirga tractuosa]|uniref:PIN domain-containing protein n=1 Tax=Marivirga tractuosa (strain ATCC 23168 / DSM 4126 / NBRC 15989 / NCIMB 1408 / VKM B-1430 / H-43) TaxID=643867 RepID=E4TN76_MARTH|nr:hypothetical protein [Marivirga tractuosa]ADR23464.1 hypothetical protein Ftrac_3492 [Marivirga tractuosa DSM 4126]BDD15859.1 hypothetical protein MATR_26840 [Marivirga tractuosa]